MIRGLVPWKPTPRPRRVPTRRSYAGALVNRLTDDWIAPLLSANKAIEGGMMTIRARARALVRNNPHAAAAVRLFQDNVTGPTGMTLQAEVAFSNGNLRRPLNDQIEAAWRAWHNDPAECSVDGRLSGADFQRLVMASLLVDGEAIIHRRRAFQNRFGYAVDLIDPDQLDETYNRAASADANEIRYGIEVNADGRPVAYHLIQGHPSEVSSMGRRRKRIAAADILHVYFIQRPNQWRGVSAFAPVMTRLHMLDGFEEASLVAARAAATNPIVFAQDPEVYAAPDDGATQADVELEMEPGVSRLLPPGVSAQMLSPEHPTTTFTEFDKAMLRSIAGGLGVAYTSLTQDLTDVNYSSIRAGLLAERDVWRGLQEWFATHVLTPLYRDWLAHASAANAVALPTMELRQWWAHRFEGRGWSWVDPLNDVQAAELEIALGLNTRTALARERGRDYEAMARQLSAEQEIAEEWEVNVDGVKRQTQEKANGGTTGTGGAADVAPDDAGAAGRAVRLVRRRPG